jgi:anthranilate phosphoribosyltransferase
MDSLAALIEELENGRDLTTAAAEGAARSLASPAVPGAPKKQFLAALHRKGESVEEVAAFARVFRELARDPGLAEFAARGIDIVGTGGSASGGFNVSSSAAVTVAACGVPVLKHGNRAITSQSGAADFLGVLGLPIQENPAILRRSLEELNFCFFFAPAFHPAFKEIMPVRKELAAEGQRTVFNILGPLINPAKPAYQVLGVFAESWVQPLAEVLSVLGLKAGIAAQCALEDGRSMDELTTCGTNTLAGIGALRALSGTFEARAFGLSHSPGDHVSGGTPTENVAIFEGILRGDGPDGLRDTIALTAGAALHVTGHAPDIAAGAQQALAALSDGTVAQWLERARTFYGSL